MRSILFSIPLVVAAASGARADVFIRGDANLDGKVDLADAIAILDCLFLGQGCVDCADASDANDDGAVNIGDPIHWLTFAFLGGSQPPPPYPSAGVDPSGDLLGCASGLGPEGPPGVIISEIMYHPYGDDPRDEYVEIHNRGPREPPQAEQRGTPSRLRRGEARPSSTKKDGSPCSRRDTFE